MDPFQGLATFVLGRMKDSSVALWWRFIFELVFSALGSFLFICGLTLVGSRVWSLSIGSGMVASAVSMVALFRKESSRLTKGMMVVLPQSEAVKEMETDLQVIQKEKS